MALIAGGTRVTHGAIDRLAAGIDQILEGRGVARTMPIAFSAQAELGAVSFALALFRAGRPLLPIHPRWTNTETNQALGLLPEVFRVGDGALAEILERAPHESKAPVPDPDPDDLAAIVFTSGTNAGPKPVLVERRAFTASARASAENLGWVDGDRWLLALPFSHVGGLSVLTRCLLARRTVVLSGSDPEAMLEADASILSLVPAQLHRLLEVDRENRLARARVMLLGGAELSLPLRREASLRGIVALASYGLSETCAQIVAQSPDEHRDPSSMDSGRALRGVEVRINDKGCIEVRGPMLMRGYANGPRLARDAFFATQDLGELDAAGRLHVLGRADDTIVTGGENVHPSEVERAALTLEAVKGALCFGIPDARFGQLVALAVVLAPGANDESVLGSAFLNLAEFKRPRRSVVVNELPLGPSNKPDRRRATRELADRTKPLATKPLATKPLAAGERT